MSDDYLEYEQSADATDVLKWVSLGFGIGLLMGGIVGLLMAPKSGKETQEQLKGYAKDLSGKTKDLASNLQTKGSEFGHEVSEKVTRSASEFREKATEVASTAREYYKAGKEAVGRVASAIKEPKDENGSFHSEAEGA